MKDNKFIITNDEDTASSLFAAGFVLISNKNGQYTFLNEPPTTFKFDTIKSSNYRFSNTLCV